MAIVGYVRVSTADQNLERQLAVMEEQKVEKTFSEKASAKTVNRPVWNQCKEYCREGDTLIIPSLDRVVRSGAGDVIAIVEELTAKGVSVNFIKEGMSFSATLTAVQKGILSILASVSTMERELLLERQREGIAAAKEQGRTGGRPAVVTKEQVQELKLQGLTQVQVSERLGVSSKTVARNWK